MNQIDEQDRKECARIAAQFKTQGDAMTRKLYRENWASETDRQKFYERHKDAIGKR